MSFVGIYRPNSITPVIAKVVETIMKVQLLCHFEANNLFSEAQLSFRRGRLDYHSWHELG